MACFRLLHDDDDDVEKMGKIAIPVNENRTINYTTLVLFKL